MASGVDLHCETCAATQIAYKWFKASHTRDTDARYTCHERTAPAPCRLGIEALTMGYNGHGFQSFATSNNMCWELDKYHLNKKLWHATWSYDGFSLVE
jgi:hypothetical protein